MTSAAAEKTAPERDARPPCALVICTYRRRAMLERTLRSLAAQDFDRSLRVIVVEKDAPAGALPRPDDPWYALDHVRYDGPPSAARQRNAGLDRLGPDAAYVFFLDDDVTLHDGYLRALASALDDDDDLGGAGGLMLGEKRPDRRGRLARALRRLFLIEHRRAGRVLPSGKATAVQTAATTERTRTEWLSTCSSVYRRALLERHRFDPAVPGALLEDRDLSYRISRAAPLVVEPQARLVHHRSERNRPDVRSYAYLDTVQRCWFVEKNVRHPLGKAAFWWATLGRALAILTSDASEKDAAFEGLWQGARAVWQRNHPLLR
jgi:GT2 family glycosyltransferase